VFNALSGPKKKACQLIILKFSLRWAIFARMVSLIRFLFSMLRTTLRTCVSQQLEVAALRHQLSVYQDAGERPQITPANRLLWSLISTWWSDWRRALCFVQPRTVIAWQ
jgi:hypothetical protein